jgi:hypothetical protein
MVITADTSQQIVRVSTISFSTICYHAPRALDMPLVLASFRVTVSDTINLLLPTLWMFATHRLSIQNLYLFEHHCTKRSIGSRYVWIATRPKTMLKWLCIGKCKLRDNRFIYGKTLGLVLKGDYTSTFRKPWWLISSRASRMLAFNVELGENK